MQLISLLIEAVLKLQTVNLTDQTGIDPHLLIDRLLYALPPCKDNLIISIDRTEWKYESQ